MKPQRDMQSRQLPRVDYLEGPLCVCVEEEGGRGRQSSDVKWTAADEGRVRLVD